MESAQVKITKGMSETFQEFSRVIGESVDISWWDGQDVISLENRCIDEVETVVYGGFMNSSRKTVYRIYAQEDQY